MFNLVPLVLVGNETSWRGIAKAEACATRSPGKFFGFSTCPLASFSTFWRAKMFPKLASFQVTKVFLLAGGREAPAYNEGLLPVSDG